MIRLCREAGLPEPEFHHEGERFVAVIRRDWLTEELMAQLGLNERQRKALVIARSSGHLTTAAYLKATDTTRATAKRDLEQLVNVGILIPAGAGRAAHYLLTRKRLINGSNGSIEGNGENGS